MRKPLPQWFKSGELRGLGARRYRPVGAITVRTNSKGTCRRWIKVRDDGRPQDRWVVLARFIWERVNGPVPAGHRVAHADGNTLRDAIENLICIDGDGAIALIEKLHPGAEAKRIKRVIRARQARASQQRALAVLRQTGVAA